MVLADTLEFIHILAVFVLLGSLGMITYSSAMLARTEDVHKFEIYLTIGSTGGMISGLATLFTGVFGFLAAWEIGLSLTAGWLIAAYIATGAALLVPMFTLKPWGDQAGKLMDESIQAGHILPAQRALLSGPKFRAVEMFMYGLLIFIAFVMVFKPF
ncbi:MAG: hypothetical protein O3B95_11540 [Chloroflexi bacterium]|nr:hypothetical protein [Chloroflexota bacterium]